MEIFIKKYYNINKYIKDNYDLDPDEIKNRNIPLKR